MKKFSAIILSLLMLLSVCPLTALAAAESDISEFEFPTPDAPNYFIYTDGDETDGRHDDLRMLMVVDPEVAMLAAEYDRNSDAFYEKYGLWYFNIVMQYDVSLDNEENWQHNADWDTDYYTGGYADGYRYESLRSELMEDFEFFWLTYHEGEGSDTFIPYQPAITTYVYHHEDWDENIYSFDTANHSLYIRCRYYMEWEPLVENEYGFGPGEKQSKFSDWSESAVFGRNSTQVIPDEPTVYEAPVVSDLKFVEDENGSCHLEYSQTTPESVWLANVYYMMLENGEFEGLETQVSINGGEWIEFSTANSWGDWCLWNGTRGAYNSDVSFDEDDNIKLRIRFTGTHGPSAWSNVAEINAVVTPPAQSYTITVSNGTASKTTAKAGETITLTANTAPAGKAFDKWIVNGVTVANATSATTTFTMPAANVTATATYKNAAVTPTQYTVTVSNGRASKTTATAGETITLTANTPPVGKEFDKWIINDATVANATSATTTFTMPAANVTATATYKYINVAPTYTVTVTNGTASPKTAVAGQTITLTAKTPPFGKVFDKWIVDGATVANATSATTTFTMPAANVTATATFKDATVTPPVSTPHTIMVTNGTASVSSAVAGTSVTLTAKQIDGKVFSHWEISGVTVADENAKETTFTMGNADVTAEAIYENCSCKCHQGGIAGFFYKIVLFFQKLFGINKICIDCGAKH